MNDGKNKAEYVTARTFPITPLGFIFHGSGFVGVDVFTIMRVITCLKYYFFWISQIRQFWCKFESRAVNVYSVLNKKTNIDWV